MASGLSQRLLQGGWSSANELAEELAVAFNSGLVLADLRLGSIDQRYARIGAGNTFVGAQTITGSLTINQTSLTAIGLSVSGSGEGLTSLFPAIRVEALRGAGALYVLRRQPADVTADALILVDDNGASDQNAITLNYNGTGNALEINHTGTSGAALLVTGRPTQFGSDMLIQGTLSVTNTIVGQLQGNAATATLASRALVADRADDLTLPNNARCKIADELFQPNTTRAKFSDEALQALAAAAAINALYAVESGVRKTITYVESVNFTTFTVVQKTVTLFGPQG